MERITLKIEPGQNENDLAIAYLNRLGRKKTKYIVSCISQMLKTNGIRYPQELEKLSNEEILQLSFKNNVPDSINESISMQLEQLKDEVHELVSIYGQAEKIVPIKEEKVIKEADAELKESTMNNLLGNLALD